MKPLSGLGIKDASIVVELGVMREGFKEVYNADVKRPEELLERARFSNEFYASKGLLLPCKPI